jgi:hypothetical protein
VTDNVLNVNENSVDNEWWDPFVSPMSKSTDPSEIGLPNAVKIAMDSLSEV